MDYIRVDKDNLESEHICCAISSNRDIQVASKNEFYFAASSSSALAIQALI